MKLGTYSSPHVDERLYTLILRHLFVCLFVCTYKRDIFENDYELIMSVVFLSPFIVPPVLLQTLSTLRSLINGL